MNQTFTNSTATPNHALQRTAPGVTAHAPATCAPAAFPHGLRRPPQSLSLGSFGDATRPVRTTIFIILILACESFAADPPSTVLIVREYRVAPEFLTWMDPNKSPPGWDKQPKEWLVQSAVPFSNAPSPVYISESQRLLVRHTKAYHDTLNRLVTEWHKRSRNKQPDPKTLQRLRDLDAAHKQ